MVKSKSFCQGKSVKNPNKCKKINACKVAAGPKRTFCRKKKNMTKKRKATRKTMMKKKPALTRKQRALKKLGALPSSSTRRVLKKLA
jgi:hypothetical protein